MGRGKRNHPYQTFLTMANTPAFMAKLRIVGNNSQNQNAPEKNVIIDGNNQKIDISNTKYIDFSNSDKIVTNYGGLEYKLGGSTGKFTLYNDISINGDLIEKLDIASKQFSQSSFSYSNGAILSNSCAA